MEFKDKRVLITGAGSGLGKELTTHLLDLGATVIAVDKNLSKLKELVQQKPNSLDLQEVDLTDKAQVSLMMAKVSDKFTSLDVLINNAGIIQKFEPVINLNEAEIQRVFDINFFAPLNLIRLFIPLIDKTKDSLIVNISSMGSYTPVPGQSIYGASKAALKLLTEGLEMELRSSNIKVAVVFPGAMKTSIAENSGIALTSEMMKQSEQYKAMDVSKAAKEIISKLRKNKSRIYIGSDAKLMNILNRISPKIAANLIYKQMKNLLKS